MKTIPFIAALAFLLTSCVIEVRTDAPAAILPSSVLVDGAITRAAVDGNHFPLRPDIYSVTAYRGGTVPSDYSVSYFDNAFVDNETGKNVFSIPRSYPTDGDNLYFYAYAPVSDAEGLSGRQYRAGAGNTAPEVAWTITGQEDILSSQVTAGISMASMSQPAFVFRHLLKKLRFRLLRGEGFPKRVFVEKIEAVDCRVEARLDLVTGELAFVDQPAQTLSLSGLAAEIGAPGFLPAVLMNQPGRNVKLRVTTRDRTVYPAEFTLQGHHAGQAGVSHNIVLTFTPKGIVTAVTVAAWEDAGEEEGILK